MSIPKPPRGTSDGGADLWASIVNEYELDEHELSLLRQAVRTVDTIDKLQSAVDSHGALVESPQGLKTNPAIVEIRQQRIVLARLLAALRLPSDEVGDGGPRRPQRRGGVRSPGGRS